ncbi:DUF1190 domain-containing protein [Microvirga arabica]|uniref:DUF1190 domain-containing protein n=1 Tax=Microvirga arabica TaxID=1128671 RepID=A0ABV6Y2W2_9HYPH
MQGSHPFAHRMVLVLFGLAIGAPGLRAEQAAAFYLTSRACVAEGLLSPTECRNAFANAEAEFDDAVPAFDDQRECERHFRRCTISFTTTSDPKALRFAPAMRGVQVTVAVDRSRTAVPVLNSRHPAIHFAPRTVAERQDERSAGRQQEAQAKWTAAQRPEEKPVGEPSTWTLRGRVDHDTDRRPSEPQSPLLEQRLRDWCKRFCAGVTGDPNLGPALAHLHSGLFAPYSDAGAQAGGPLATGHFRPSVRATPPAPQRFVRLPRG